MQNMETEIKMQGETKTTYMSSQLTLRALFQGKNFQLKEMERVKFQASAKSKDVVLVSTFSET